jgi:hypothetical protein
MQPPKSNICVICGVSPATTDEHVPPRCFFKGLSGQFRTVPACSSCNNGSSKDDEELRLYISLQIGKQTEGAKILWEKGAHKSVFRSMQLRSNFMSTLREVPIIFPNDEVIKRLEFSVPTELYQRVFERITRGLFFWHTGAILSSDTSVKIQLLVGTPDLNSPDLKTLESHCIADGAFEYKFGIDPKNNRNTVWLFGMHQAHWLYATTGVLAADEML